MATRGSYIRTDEIRMKNRKNRKGGVKRHSEKSLQKMRKPRKSIKWGDSLYCKFNGKPRRKTEVYNELFKKQNGVCALCDKPPTIIDVRTGKVKHLCIDHNHKNQEVRALLCARCNAKLGHLEDIEFVLKAKMYLEEHSKGEQDA